MAMIAKLFYCFFSQNGEYTIMCIRHCIVLSYVSVVRHRATGLVPRSHWKNAFKAQNSLHQFPLTSP